MDEIRAVEERSIPPTELATLKSAQDILRFLEYRWNEMDETYKEKETDFDEWLRLYNIESDVPEDYQLSKLMIPTVFSEVESQVPDIIDSIFGMRPLYEAIPTGQEDVDPARMIEHFLDFQFFRIVDWFLTIRRHLTQALVTGFSPVKVGWDFERRVPKLMFIPIEDFRIDPKATTMNDCRDMFHIVEVTRSRLKKLKEFGVYKNVDVLLNKYSGDEDEKVQVTDKIKLIEYFSKDRMITTDEDFSIILRDRTNWLGQLPFVWATDTPDLYGIYGKGIPKIVADLADEYQTRRRQTIDFNSLLLSPMMKVRRGADVDIASLQNWRTGGVVFMSDLAATEFMTPPAGQGMSLTDLTFTEKNIQDATGNYFHAKGAPSPRRETATGLLSLQREASKRVMLKVHQVAETTFHPLAKLMLLYAKEFLPAHYMVQVFGDKGLKWEQFKKEWINLDRDVQCRISSLRVPRELHRQELITLIGFLSSPQFFNKVDWFEMGKRLLQEFGIRDINKIFHQEAPGAMMPGAGGMIPQQGMPGQTARTPQNPQQMLEYLKNAGMMP